MKNKVLRKTLAVSLLGHLTIFGMFSVSFGPKIPSAADYAQVSFLGRILGSADLLTNRIFTPSRANKITADIKNLTLPSGEKEESGKLAPYYFKPLAIISQNNEKEIFSGGPSQHELTYKMPEQSIILYPQLPYYFQLYFKDRQRVRIELLFNVMSDGKRDILLIKRKISSGNLEADLLSMRYINHYLSLQQSGFTKNSWQAIKIELSAKND